MNPYSEDASRRRDEHQMGCDMELIAGIDVGGTFTDVLIYDTDSRDVRLSKVSSTPDLQAIGLLHGLHQFDVELSDLSAVVHGTTVATNAVLERKGSRTALVTTQGFRDVLELRRRERPNTYGLTGTFRPLVPRSMCFEVDERIGPAGEIVVPLRQGSVTELATVLRQRRVESVAICLLHSYANPVHEQQVATELERLLPDVPVTLSHLVSPVLGEFERASTTVVNAFVRQTMTRYLDAVQNKLEAEGFERDVQVMQSNGGLMPARRAGELSVRTVLSGPAAGTVAAAAIGQAVGEPDVISCDMGGTSFDVTLVPGGRPTVTTNSSIAYGVPIALPMIDIKTIGAGGGSIARIDRAGILQVGPESAGASPGPACYGRGGIRPTVTDANIVLGRIATDQSLGTEDGFVLDRDAAARSIAEHVAAPLKLDVVVAALAIIRLANEKMANAIRMVSVDKGEDPRKFALVGFGGAGPLHIVELARAIGATTVLIPPYPGALSAFGCLSADLRYDYTTSINADIAECDAGGLAETLVNHRERGVKQLAQDGADVSDTFVDHVAEMHFRKQIYTLRVPLGAVDSGWTPDRLRTAFVDSYRASYGESLPSGGIRLASLQTTVTGRRPPVDPIFTRKPASRPATMRPVTFADGTHDTTVIDRDSLTPGTDLPGPAVIQQADTTILLPPNTRGTVQATGTLVVKVNP